MIIHISVSVFALIQIFFLSLSVIIPAFQVGNSRETLVVVCNRDILIILWKTEKHMRNMRMSSLSQKEQSYDWFDGWERETLLEHWECISDEKPTWHNFAQLLLLLLIPSRWWTKWTECDTGSQTDRFESIIIMMPNKTHLRMMIRWLAMICISAMRIWLASRTWMLIRCAWLNHIINFFVQFCIVNNVAKI